MTLECGARGFSLNVEWKFKNETAEIYKSCISKFETGHFSQSHSQPSISQSVSPSVRPSVRPSVSQSVSQSVNQSVSQSDSQLTHHSVSKSENQ